MAKNKKYNDVKSAVEMLERNSHAVVVAEKTVGLYNPGLKVLSAADYLAHYHGYKISFVH